jgi:hypothetical protein
MLNGAEFRLLLRTASFRQLSAQPNPVTTERPPKSSVCTCAIRKDEKLDRFGEDGLDNEVNKNAEAELK